MRPLLVLGAGTFAVEALDIAETMGGFDVRGFLVSRDQAERAPMHAGLPVYRDDDLPFQPPDVELVAGIVSTRRRGLVESLEARGYRFATLIHPSAVISRRSSLDDGCVVNAGVVVSANTRIERQVVINRGCLIGHDNLIEPFVTLGPGANVAGAVTIRSGSYIGVGAVIRDHLEIGPGAIVGAGSVVVKPIPARALAVGLPARIAREGVDPL